MTKELTLKTLRNIKPFEEVYQNLFLPAKLTEKNKNILIEVAITLLKVKNKDLRELAYRIILLYSIKTRDYTALYDVCYNFGYFPVVKLIERVNQEIYNENSFFHLYQSSHSEVFKSKNYIETYEQFLVRFQFTSNIESGSFVVVAPTSYGKSELIEQSSTYAGNVCILVPTKALLAQTKRRILKSENLNEKVIITHPDVDLPEEKQGIIAILTQERLIRLFQIYDDLIFDTVFVDEAHNLLDDSDRSRLLASAIAMLKKKNSETTFAYLTPFLEKIENLKITNFDFNTTELKINEKIKTEKIFIYDFRTDNILYLYDQYFNDFLEISTDKFSNYYNFIKYYASAKNIVYLNRPADVQHLAVTLAKELPETASTELKHCINDLKEITHNDYEILFCLNRGVAYHHGSMPDNIKLYIEHLYTKFDSIKFMVTTSTLLEGVNIPAEKIFILDNRKGIRTLTPSQFKNLIGRVCRFSEIFNEKNRRLELLTPEIYLLGTKFSRLNANLKNYVKKVMQVDKEVKDFPENILLENTKDTDEKKEKLADYGEFINNVEEGIVANIEYRKPTTEFGKECFKNNIFEIDIISNENLFTQKIDRLRENDVILSDPIEIMRVINDVFIENISESDKASELKRLKNLGARNFYSMLLRWRVENIKMFQQIWAFLQFWDELVGTEDYPYVYVGKWGDEKRNGPRPFWINIATKTQHEKINLAIVRIKDEQDFIDNTIMKFIEVLYSSHLIEEITYKQIKYGTNDDYKIDLSRGGMSLSLASIVAEKYKSFIVTNLRTNQVSLKSNIIDEMAKNKENDVVMYEASFHVRK